MRDLGAPFIVGISGGSGSGKTTFARALVGKLGSDTASSIHQDNYYLDQSAIFVSDGGDVNFDHPNALEFSLLAQHLKDLHCGKSIEVPQYDFVTHTRLSESICLTPKPIVLLDGILILNDKDIRENLDLSIFIHASEEVRFSRRLKRDVQERGRSREGVLAQLNNHVKPMHDLFVEPSRKFADHQISGETDFQQSLAEMTEVLVAKLPR